MRAYVLNLDRRPDRLAEMEAECRRVGLEMVRVPAVDGQTLPEEEVRRYHQNLLRHRPRTTVDWAAGMLGCLRSHRAANTYAAIVGAEFPYWVLEDDARFVYDPVEVVRTSEESDLGWRVMVLGGYPADPKAVPYYDGSFRGEDWYCAHAYCVRDRETSDRLVELWVEELYESDRSWWPVLRDGGWMLPEGARQAAGFSDIGARRKATGGVRVRP